MDLGSRGSFRHSGESSVESGTDVEQMRGMNTYKIGVKVRVKNVRWLAMRGHDQSGKVIGDRSMIWRSENRVDSGHEVRKAGEKCV